MQQIIRDLIELANDPELQKSYCDRQKELEEWLESKKVKNIQKGQQVDIRDTEDIWCIGIIKEIYENENHGKTLLIHYQGNSNKAGMMCMMSSFVRIRPDWPPLGTSPGEEISPDMPI